MINWYSFFVLCLIFQVNYISMIWFVLSRCIIAQVRIAMHYLEHRRCYPRWDEYFGRTDVRHLCEMVSWGKVLFYPMFYTVRLSSGNCCELLITRFVVRACPRRWFFTVRRSDKGYLKPVHPQLIQLNVWETIHSIEVSHKLRGGGLDPNLSEDRFWAMSWAMARTCTNNSRVVLGPQTQC